MYMVHRMRCSYLLALGRLQGTDERLEQVGAAVVTEQSPELHRHRPISVCNKNTTSNIHYTWVNPGFSKGAPTGDDYIRFCENFQSTHEIKKIWYVGGATQFNNM